MITHLPKSTESLQKIKGAQVNRLADRSSAFPKFIKKDQRSWCAVIQSLGNLYTETHYNHLATMIRVGKGWEKGGKRVGKGWEKGGKRVGKGWEKGGKRAGKGRERIWLAS